MDVTCPRLIGLILCAPAPETETPTPGTAHLGRSLRFVRIAVSELQFRQNTGNGVLTVSELTKSNSDRRSRAHFVGIEAHNSDKIKKSELFEQIIRIVPLTASRPHYAPPGVCMHAQRLPDCPHSTHQLFLPLVSRCVRLNSCNIRQLLPENKGAFQRRRLVGQRSKSGAGVVVYGHPN